jgi:hypothetical protein
MIRGLSRPSTPSSCRPVEQEAEPFQRLPEGSAAHCRVDGRDNPRIIKSGDGHDGGQYFRPLV